MRIGLLGFPFKNANKGCEALTYSIIHILREILENEHLEIVSFNTSSNTVLENYFPDLDFITVRAKIKDFSCFREFRKCDFVFDATSGDGFSDIYFKNLVLRTTLMKECVILSRTPLVLMPQTYGPFEDNNIRKFAVHTIRKAYRVYSRDQKSIDFINQYAKIDVLKVTDLAFSLPFERKVFPANGVGNVGLNISGLLWKGGFEKNNQFNLTVDYHKYIEELITSLLSLGYVLHLIPHVIENDNDKLDGDVQICSELYKKYKCSNLCLAPSFTSPIEAKNYISGMDVFIGARMHSTIAAFSSNVPVIPFSYSRKFEGLYENLNYPFIIHGQKSTTEDAISQTLDWINDKDTIKNTIGKELKTVLEYQMIFKSDLCQLLLKKEKQSGKKSH